MQMRGAERSAVDSIPRGLCPAAAAATTVRASSCIPTFLNLSLMHRYTSVRFLFDPDRMKPRPYMKENRRTIRLLFLRIFGIDNWPSIELFSSSFQKPSRSCGSSRRFPRHRIVSNRDIDAERRGRAFPMACVRVYIHSYPCRSVLLIESSTSVLHIFFLSEFFST